MEFKKHGKFKGKQRYKCLYCGKTFNCISKKIPKWVSQAYDDYCFKRFILKDLSVKYKKSIKTIRKYFDLLDLNSQKRSKKRLIKKENEKERREFANKNINLVFDGTFFSRNYGFLIYRANSKNIHYRKIESEKIEYIKEDLLYLSNEVGYAFKSFTIDGRRGVIQLLKRIFPNTPIQMCQFHQQQIVRRYNTNNPKTDCGIELKELMKEMRYLNHIEFEYELLLLKTKYKDFLKERNENNDFKHKRLRSAFRSLKINLPYLFTYKKYPDLNIPNTTNTCEGSFAYWKNKVKIHRGLSKKRREEMIKKLIENC